MDKTTEQLPFVDAQEMHRNHPSTFDAPQSDELDNLTIDDNVKVCTHGERFWCRVVRIDGDTIIAAVNNEVIEPAHGLQYGDQISFEKRHIYNIF